MAVEGSVPYMGQIVPHLVVRDTQEALAFYERAFGAKLLYRSASPSGAGEHLHLKIWGSLIQVSTEEPQQRQQRVEGAPMGFAKARLLHVLLQTCFGETAMDGFETRKGTSGRSQLLTKF